MPRRSIALVLALTLCGPAAGLDWQDLRSVGAVRAAIRLENGVQLACADGAIVRVTVLAPDLIRVRTVFAGQVPPPDHSWAIERTDWNPPPWQFTESPAALTLATAELRVVIHRDPLRLEFVDAVTGRVINADERPMARDPQTGRIAAAKRLGFDEHFYGLGEKTARLDKRRGQFVMWNSDTPGYIEGTDPIYQSIPFYLGWEEGRAYGLFYDNAHRSTFDLGRTGQDYAGYSAEGGVLDYYFFSGPALKKIIGRYTELTGRMPLPPLWALGHQQSRYSYYPDTMVERVAAEYRARDLPLDVIHLDIHYMDAYRVFTWHPVRFPDPAGLAHRLAAQGVRLITIVDPGVKYQPETPGYHVFDEGAARDYFLRRQDGSLYIGEVWPGKSVFVDYTRADARRWWGEQHRALTDRGVAGIWTDMNEPSDFIDKSGETQKNVVFDDLGAKSLYAQNRNTFALNMARATYEGLQNLQPGRRPFVITRAGYAGIQRYAITWIGDSNATFDALALSLPMFMSLGLTGQAFVGADTPGFIGRADGELLARSYQVAAFTPFCRNHVAVDIYDHEPWRFGKPYEAIVRKYLKLRYQLLPFLYTTIEEAHRTGLPLFRPLLLEFQDDVTTLNLDDQFMVGSALLAAPVLRAGERARDVYLPAGRWYDFWSGAALDGGDLRRVDAPLDRLPLFVRGGSIVPSTVAMNHTGEKPWNPLRFDVWPDAAGTAAGSLYEDDGLSPAHRQGAFRRTTLQLAAGKLTFAATGTFQPPARRLEFAVHAVPNVTTVTRDGQPLAAGTDWSRDENGVLVIRLEDDGRPHALEFR